MNTLKVKCVLLKAVLPCLQNPILINGEISCLFVAYKYVKLVGIGKRTSIYLYLSFVIGKPLSISMCRRPKRSAGNG